MVARSAAESGLGEICLLTEGFATYAARRWFLDLYPFATRKAMQQLQLNPETIHYKGFRKVQELVKEHGVGILMDIPKHWRDF